jgi:hypothetical protein
MFFFLDEHDFWLHYKKLGKKHQKKKKKKPCIEVAVLRPAAVKSAD